MRNTIRLSVPGLALALSVPLAVAAYVVGGAHGSPAGAASSSKDTSRTIVMEGEGKATGVPDMMRFTVGVSVTRPDVGDAISEANKTMKKVLVALKGRGIKGRDVKTTGLSVEPTYDYSNNAQRLTGYAVNERVRVKVRHLSASGKAISTVADAGGNATRISGILLDISDRSALLKQARMAAMANAREKAGEYAEAGDVSLGHLVSLKEIQTAAPSEPVQADYLGSADGAMRASAPVPVQAGQQQLDVQVQVVWALD